jgi:hypothetical protein
VSDAWCVVRGGFRKRGAWCVVRGAPRTPASTFRLRSTLLHAVKRSALRAQPAAIDAGLQFDQRTTSLLSSVCKVKSLPFRQVSQPSRNRHLTGKFATRSDGDLEELREFARSAPPTAFGDVRTYRDGRSSHLGNQTEPFIFGKPCGQGVNRHSKVLSVRPASELREVLHWTVILGSASDRKCVGRRWCLVLGALCVGQTLCVLRDAFWVRFPRRAAGVHEATTHRSRLRSGAPRATQRAPLVLDAPRTTHHAPRVLDAPRTTHHAPQDPR